MRAPPLLPLEMAADVCIYFIPPISRSVLDISPWDMEFESPLWPLAKAAFGVRISFRYYSVLWPLAKAASGVRISFRYLGAKGLPSLIRRRNSFPPRKIPYFCALTKFSNTTTFVESAAGIGVGGRTGLTSVVVAVCFAVSAFFGVICQCDSLCGRLRLLSRLVL